MTINNLILKIIKDQLISTEIYFYSITYDLKNVLLPPPISFSEQPLLFVSESTPAPDVALPPSAAVPMLTSFEPLPLSSCSPQASYQALLSPFELVPVTRFNTIVTSLKMNSE